MMHIIKIVQFHQVRFSFLVIKSNKQSDTELLLGVPDNNLENLKLF